MPTTQQAVVICAFTASGKSFLAKQSQDLGYDVVDLDSTPYSWLPDGRRNLEFARDYTHDIRANIQRRCILLVTTHAVVRNTLVDDGCKYALVYPQRSCKTEWQRRLEDRGDSHIATILADQWDAFLDECENQQACSKYILRENQHLSDLVGEIVRDMTSEL
jgi:hypothetical protein